MLRGTNLFEPSSKLSLPVALQISPRMSRRCSSNGLALLLLGLINTSQSVELFAKLAFDELARVRPAQLASLDEVVVDQAMKRACPGVLACKPSGASKKDWEKSIVKLVAFDTGCKSQPPLDGKKGRLRYRAFLKLKRDPTWNPNFQYTFKSGDEGGGGMTSLPPVVEWLTVHKGYSTFPYPKAAQELAQDFLDNVRPGFDMMNELEVFTALDKNHGGTLDVDEVYDYMQANQADMKAELEFAAVARVRAEDFSNIDIPGVCGDTPIASACIPWIAVNGIMNTAKMHDIDKATYERMALQENIAEFVRLDTDVLKGAHQDLKKKLKQKDSLQGTLKFYQFAHALPHLGEEMNPTTRDVTFQVESEDGEKAVTIHIPTIAEVTYQRHTDVSVEDLEDWLGREMGIKNNDGFLGWFFGNKHLYAKKLAINAVAWADGRAEGSTVNGRINAKEWPGVSGRLALFCRIDKDKDGKVDFQDAYPYLKKFLQDSRAPLLV